MKYWNSLTEKKKQYIIAGVALGGVTLVGGMAVMALISADISIPEQKTEQKREAIQTASSKISPQETWVHQVEADFKKNNEKLEELKQIVESQGTIHPESTSSASEIEMMKQEIEFLKLELQNRSNQEPRSNGMSSEGAFQGNETYQDPQAGIPKLTFTLNPRLNGGEGKMSHITNTIPAGAFARAVLLGGVDASTSIQSSSDPRPVLLRVTDSGTLPRHMKSDIESCHVLASSYGDLSSERVYMRLEKLTCTNPNTGIITETQVSGFVTGEDGRTGIRGTVVDRAGESIRNTAVGGFLNGLSGFFSSQEQRSVFPVSPFGQTNALPVDKMLGAGASKGFGNAMEKYSDFFIKRAEQLQPVLQIAAGREVNIVFTQGTKFGESTVKDSIKVQREDARQGLEGLPLFQNPTESDSNISTKETL